MFTSIFHQILSLGRWAAKPDLEANYEHSGEKSIQKQRQKPHLEEVLPLTFLEM